MIGKSFIKKILNRLRGEIETEKYIASRMKLGKNFKRMQGCTFDISHCWHIEIGDDVTLAPFVQILAHDASTKEYLKYTRIGKVKIGNRVFVGANTVILPGVTIGDNVVIGAGSIVARDIPDGHVVAGNPAKKVSTIDEFLSRKQNEKSTYPCFGEEFSMRKM